ncbi:type II toxin-antitoxin system RelE/ParE family toxin [uncultured Thiohalocapsa sp.]|uniref:type II toxin-antitoxin system RelE family toxin n=1 Tax=uncultured Thiohalocapsa sp. TaxID=768990 RepID=UPI0025FE1A8C|nr:type II toxin-antitoxin system RelE/ParE family toxin [uncultured Thiohalocapsa sp.]
MMQVEWQPKALKQLKKLGDRGLQSRILRAAAGLSAFPDVPGVRQLTDHRLGYRLRVGDYRVFFDVGHAVRIVSIEAVKKRDERTY